MIALEIVLCALVFILSVVVVELAAQLTATREAFDRASEEAAELRLKTSKVLNWIAISVGPRHPQVNPVCKIAEEALITGKMPDVDTLMHRLDDLRRADLMATTRAHAEVLRHAKGGRS